MFLQFLIYPELETRFFTLQKSQNNTLDKVVSPIFYIVASHSQQCKQDKSQDLWVWKNE